MNTAIQQRWEMDVGWPPASNDFVPANARRRRLDSTREAPGARGAGITAAPLADLCLYSAYASSHGQGAPDDRSVRPGVSSWLEGAARSSGVGGADRDVPDRDPTAGAGARLRRLRLRSTYRQGHLDRLPPVRRGGRWGRGDQVAGRVAVVVVCRRRQAGDVGDDVHHRRDADGPVELRGQSAVARHLSRHDRRAVHPGWAAVGHRAARRSS